ncbi:MAG: nodulation protein NodH, partial [Paracoccaceae bacterium]
MADRDRPFHSFVVFAAMRTGSNLLEAELNSFDGVTCHGELFNPAFIGGPAKPKVLGMSKPERDADPGRLLQLVQEVGGLNGFRFFPGHDERVLPMLLQDRGCAKIILRRNPLDSYVSLKIARQTGQWRMGDGRTRKEAKATFQAEEFASYRAELEAYYQALQRLLQYSG